MAKRKKNFEPTDDVEYQASLVAALVQVINPQVPAMKAYPIVLDMIETGLTEDNVEMFGLAIRATAYETDQTH